MALNPEAEGAGGTGVIMTVAALVLVAIMTYIISYRVHQPATIVYAQDSTQAVHGPTIVQAPPAVAQNPATAPASPNATTNIVPPAGGDTSSAVDMKPS